jgi:hypothetical protein
MNLRLAYSTKNQTTTKPPTFSQTHQMLMPPYTGLKVKWFASSNSRKIIWRVLYSSCNQNCQILKLKLNYPKNMEHNSSLRKTDFRFSNKRKIQIRANWKDKILECLSIRVSSQLKQHPIRTCITLRLFPPQFRMFQSILFNDLLKLTSSAPIKEHLRQWPLLLSTNPPWIRLSHFNTGSTISYSSKICDDRK